MNAASAMKIGDVYVSIGDMVNITATGTTGVIYTTMGRVIDMNHEWMLIDDSKEFHGSKFQAWYKTLTSIIVAPEVTP